MQRQTSLLLLPCLPVAASGLAGSIHLGSERIALTDGFAMPFSSAGASTIDLVATSLPLDRALIAKDQRTVCC